MKDSPVNILAFKTIFLFIFVLSTLSFLSIIVQCIDFIIGFSQEAGYHTNNVGYFFKNPLIYIGTVLCIYHWYVQNSNGYKPISHQNQRRAATKRMENKPVVANWNVL